MALRWPPEALESALNRPTRPQDRSKTPQDTTTRPPEASRWPVDPQFWPVRPKDQPHMPPRGPMMSPRWTEDASRLSQACPKSDRRNLPEIIHQHVKTSRIPRLRSIHPSRSYCARSSHLIDPTIHASILQGGRRQRRSLKIIIIIK